MVGLLVCLVLIIVVRVRPILRRGRVVVLDRPKPCSMDEAQHALDRLVEAGFDAEIYTFSRCMVDDVKRAVGPVSSWRFCRAIT